MKHDATKMLSYLIDMFPNWKTTKPELNLYRTIFEGYDQDIVRKGIDRFKKGDRSEFGPKVNSIINCIRASMLYIKPEHIHIVPATKQEKLGVLQRAADGGNELAMKLLERKNFEADKLNGE